jgi:hypothetical protein
MVKTPVVKIPVAVINESTILDDDEVKEATEALKRQVRDHFAKAWGIDADLEVFGKDDKRKLPEDRWWLVILDDSDQGNVLGYHELNSNGLPIAKVFAKTDRESKVEWTVTASHELLEMLVDPNTNSTASVNTPYGQFHYAREICDPCEAEKLGYRIDLRPEIDREVLVSDFVYPAWFDPTREIGAGPFDHRGLALSPLQCLPGSHMDVYDVNRGAWRTFWGEGQPYRYESHPAPGSRRARRRRAPAQWRESRAILRDRRLVSGG